MLKKNILFHKTILYQSQIHQHHASILFVSKAIFPLNIWPNWRNTSQKPYVEIPSLYDIDKVFWYKGFYEVWCETSPSHTESHSWPFHKTKHLSMDVWRINKCKQHTSRSIHVNNLSPQDCLDPSIAQLNPKGRSVRLEKLVTRCRKVTTNCFNRFHYVLR